MAPVAHALGSRGLDPLLVFTGQHSTLNPADHRLDSYPHVRLACPGQDDPHVHVGTVTRALLPLFSETSPALVVVQGDTSSALGGALAARLSGSTVAHVEAGLRSHDRRSPWPEEEFRIAIDADADLLFAPTELSAANLRRERVRGQIHVTGNSGVDAVLKLGKVLDVAAKGNHPRLLVTCHRRENWGQGTSGIATAIRTIASSAIAKVEVILHPNPTLSAHVRGLLLGQAGVSLRKPLSHAQTVAAIVRSDLVLSDSGGIQEEAAALGVPLLVLRERTERPEAIASGNLQLVGTDPDHIVKAVRNRLNGRFARSPSLPFGDGHAGERIAAIIDTWLTAKDPRQLQ